MNEFSNPLGDAFGPDAAGVMSDAEVRRQAAAEAASLGLPSTESEEWRYSPIADLDLDGFAPATSPAQGTAEDPFVDLVDRAATVTVIDGWVTAVDVDPGWAAKGLIVESTSLAPSGPAHGDLFAALHTAFSPGAVQIDVPAGLEVSAPIVVRNHHRGAGQASFPQLVVRVGANGRAEVLEYSDSAGPGLTVPRIDLAVGDGARLMAASVQDLHPETIQIGRQYGSVGAQATLSTAHGAFGGRYARLRTETDLVGRGGHVELTAAYFGNGEQALDFRPFQHHRGADTTSNLVFKGVVDERSSSIYTGLIHIHPEARGSNAHQTNRNITLSQDAWAWSVPNLEIENNDVRCSHASTVSPVEADQRFYLAARGVPPTVADRLIISGFFNDLLERMPTAIRSTSQRLVDAKLASQTSPELDAEVA